MQLSDWVIWNDHHLVLVNKPAGIPVQTDKSGDKALIEIMSSYCKTSLYLVNRIDRPATGLVVFAKKKTALTHLSSQFQNRTVEKTYLAVVPNKAIKEKAQLIHFLRKDGKRHKAIIEAEGTKGQKAILDYEVIGKIENYQLLKVDLQTGRFHQIRAQLAAIECPIKGDVKYGARRKNKDRSIHLHAWKIGFQHPSTQEKILLKAAVPTEVVWNAFSLDY